MANPTEPQRHTQPDGIGRYQAYLRRRRRPYLIVKRLVDLVAGVAGLVVLSPLMILIGVAVLVDSGRPVLYQGVRTAEGGGTFRILKFRTMVTGAEKPGGDTTAYNDPRVTRMGRVLRRFKLDELPQLWNVVRGEMSLVGPRPELPVYTSKYRGVERAILAVTPGITDFSSLEFRSLDRRVGSVDADGAFEREVLPVKNRLRLQYVRSASLGTDLLILIRTLATLFRP